MASYLSPYTVAQPQFWCIVNSLIIRLDLGMLACAYWGVTGSCSCQRMYAYGNGTTETYECSWFYPGPIAVLALPPWSAKVRDASRLYNKQSSFVVIRYMPRQKYDMTSCFSRSTSNRNPTSQGSSSRTTIPENRVNMSKTRVKNLQLPRPNSGNQDPKDLRLISKFGLFPPSRDFGI